MSDLTWKREAFPFEELVDDVKRLVASHFLDLLSLIFLGMTSKSNKSLAHDSISESGRVKRERLYKKLARYGSKKNFDFVLASSWRLGRRNINFADLFLEELLLRNRIDILHSFRIEPRNLEKWAYNFQYGPNFSSVLSVLRVSYLIGASGSPALKEYLCGPEVNFPCSPLSFANGLAYGGHLVPLIESFALSSDLINPYELGAWCRLTIPTNRFQIVDYLRSKYWLCFSRAEAEKLGDKSVVISRPFSDSFESPTWSKKLPERMLNALKYLDAAGAPLGSDRKALKSIIIEGDSLESLLFLEEKYQVLSTGTSPFLDGGDLRRLEASFEKSDRIRCLSYLLEKFPTLVLSDLSLLWKPLVRRLFEERGYWDPRALSLVLQKYLNLFELLAKYAKPRSKIVEDVVKPALKKTVLEVSDRWFWGDEDFAKILAFFQSERVVIPEALLPLLPKQ